MSTEKFWKWWSDDLQWKPNNSEKNLSIASRPLRMPHGHFGLKQRLCREKPPCARPTYGWDMNHVRLQNGSCFVWCFFIRL
jgi:hypothetical protein